jgi:hypothetical protein
MTIVKIEYERIKNLGNYENAKIKAIANVDEGEDPSEVLDDLRQWVKNELGEEVHRRIT